MGQTHLHPFISYILAWHNCLGQVIQGRDKPDEILFHDIRRTVKTNMLNAGMDKAYRDKIMGHSLMGMDVHYLALSEEDLHRAMAIYTSWLDVQIANDSQNASQEVKKELINLR